MPVSQSTLNDCIKTGAAIMKANRTTESPARVGKTFSPNVIPQAKPPRGLALTPKERKALEVQKKREAFDEKMRKASRVAVKPGKQLDKKPDRMVVNPQPSLRKPINLAIKPPKRIIVKDKSTPKTPIGTSPVIDKKLDKSIDYEQILLTAVLYNGIYTVMSDLTGDATDIALKKIGFERMGKAIQFKCTSPKAFKLMVDLLASKYDIPPKHKSALDKFAALYAKNQSKLPFLKNNIAAYHNFWKLDQKQKAKTKKEIRPTPIMEDNNVLIYIPLETCPAAQTARSLTLPSGVKKPMIVAPALMKFMKSKNDVMNVITALKAKKINVLDKQTLIQELKGMK